MELQANARTLTNVLSVNKKYIVPRFQREYSWGKEQVSELWNDIVTNIHWQQDGQYHYEEYFIGALVLVGQETSSELMIVDGQQRLTTLTILLSALCDKFKQINELAVAQSIYNNYISGIDDDGKSFFKLVNETPKPYFQNNIQHIDKRGDGPESVEEKNLQSAYNDLTEYLSEDNLSKSLGLDEETFIYLEALKAVRDQVLRFLKVIYITVNDEDEAYTIFETLNARGLNLSYADLIKNKLFKKLNSTHPDDDAKTKWNKIRKIIGSRNGVGSVETFIRHWWVSKYSYVSSDTLYKAFLDKWNKGVIDAEEFIDELLSDAEIYVKISSPTEQDFPEVEMRPILKGLQALRLFNISQNKPFLLSLFKARSKGTLKLADMNRAVLSIERFHFMFNAVCSLRPSGIESAYAKAARALVDEAATKASNRQVIKALLDMLVKRKPEFSVFLEKFGMLKFSNQELKNKRLIQYIFNRLELHYIKTGEYMPDSLTLEHIYPQSSGRHEVYSMIGNLLPLSKELNEKAGNKSVKDKINIYKESKYALVQIFVDQFENRFEERWESDLILLRTTELCDLSYNSVWKLG
ncbi:DUF262 domain-containing protein [Klebsiella pneumoniae]|nr:DUF262 domain-containing protein [Klebsiella pneumoniae]EIV6999532.1 DUF262 domain-containing protein [Klebsiella pneumoniae]MBK2885426.1 DUF262 domain-containing protein [Klebsiella pneumoniae]MBS2072694.1 DUF262 domain-containing protein [Klebsiella pneumoniae]MBX9237467.1 DUF262 domain-containing HNH endonuclease family protein [Klebsiella pneumoniae]MBZ1819769.1 DUF262 domain-containing protein [Klebsiella pneumoniae]